MEIIKKLSAKEKDIYKAEPVTIAFFGDSVTQGCFECYETEEGYVQTVFDNDNSYSAKVKKILNLLYPKAQLNIIDSGISGAAGVDAPKRIERDVLRYHPDLTVVCFGLNDCGNGKTGVDAFEKAIDEVIVRLKDAKSEVVVMTPNMMCSYTSCHIMKDELLSKISKDISENQVNGNLDLYVEKLKAVAKKNQVPVCDVYSKWKTLAQSGVNTTELLANYLNHPIRDMHWLFAYSLVETMFAN